MPVSDEDFKEAARIAGRHTDLRLGHETRLVHGLYFENRVTGKWVLSIYRNVKNGANDVEIAIDWRALVWPADGDQFRPALDWLRFQQRELEHEPSGIHSTQPPDAFRIGLLWGDARTFLDRLTDRLTDKGKNRWLVPAARSGAPTTLSPEELRSKLTPPSDPWSHQIEQMLRTVRSTCDQSGAIATVVAKTKEFRFASEDQFRNHVQGLLVGGRCALTGVVLDVSMADPDLMPSLDRIDSDGHYEPGNLQIVARFANRWKSDDSDMNFRRLLAFVRDNCGDSSA